MDTPRIPAQPPAPSSGTAANPAPETPPPPDLLPGDFYLDGPYLVFTAQYHLRRGYCCNSGCRHCPYQ